MIVKRLHQQHTSVVMTIPKVFCKELEVCAGDYVVMDIKPGDGNKKIFVMEKWEVQDVGDSRDTDFSDRGG